MGKRQDKEGLSAASPRIIQVDALEPSNERDSSHSVRVVPTAVGFRALYRSKSLPVLIVRGSKP